MEDPLIFGYYLFSVTNLMGTQEAKQAHGWMCAYKPVALVYDQGKG